MCVQDNNVAVKACNFDNNDIIEIPNSGAKTREDFVSDRDFYLYCLRHSCAHLLAAAVQKLYPEAKFGIGPAIENGFYYDINLPEPISEHDLSKIEKQMRKLASSNGNLLPESITKAKAIEFFTKTGQDFKLDIIKDLEDTAVLTIFKLRDFVDLCRGPHVKRTGLLKNFKLTSVSAAYWRGDQNNASMQRIYGTVWETKEDLEDYLARLATMKERDHRNLGTKLELFKAMPFAPGCPILLPHGMIVFREMSNYIRDIFTTNGYQEVRGPIMCHQSLWETSGHWEKYHDDMFLIEGEEGNQYGLKPMNCPIHMSIYGMKPRSYRELPYRLHDQSPLHRNEASGALSGMTRLKMFCQDDTHIFLPAEQIQAEITRILKLTDHVYSVFGLKYKLKLSTRPDNALGNKEDWDLAEEALANALKENGREYILSPKDGAFYGPKIDLDVEDALGRYWQVATIQLDFQMPQRFNLKYIDKDGSEKMPVVIHNAIFGAVERFMAILIESYNGRFPLWLAPVQARILPISDDVAPWARTLHKALLVEGLRVEYDDSAERLGKKIALAEAEKISCSLIIGKREAENKEVTLRFFGNKEQVTMNLDAAVKIVKEKSARPPLIVV